MDQTRLRLVIVSDSPLTIPLSPYCDPGVRQPEHQNVFMPTQIITIPGMVRQPGYPEGLVGLNGWQS